MLDYIAYLLVKLFIKILGLVPIEGVLAFARWVGGIAFVINKKRRLVAYANLKSAFAAEKSPKELRAITKRAYQNLLQTVFEIGYLPKIDKAYVEKYIKIENFERIQKAPSMDRGMILLTGHYGDWELSSITSALVGFPILVLAREQKMKRVNELLNQIRESKGCKVIRKGMSTKNILRALYEKNIVGILSDQDAGKNGVFVNFFGRPTSCHIGPAHIAKRTNSIILPNFIVRINGPYHRVFLEEYIDPKDFCCGNETRDITQRFSSLLESYVRKYPDQWLWMHKRWKSTPTRTVLVLNDGRAGHLNQSLAVAKQVQEARVDQGYKIEDTRVVIVDVKYKHKLFGPILSMGAALVSWRCHGRMDLMKLCLEKGSYESLMKTYSEFVVSCGSGLAPVNIFMSRENNAKNIVIMKPNVPFALRKFTLAFVPVHDSIPSRKNVVTTSMAPNTIDAERITSDAEKLSLTASVKSDRVISLFVGGDNPEYSLTKDMVGSIVTELASFCSKYDYELLVTTSRRTSVDVEAMLKEKLSTNPRCKLLVIANEKNLDNAVGGMLGLAKIAVVSGESVSMISEAVSAKKRVVVFKPIKKDDKVTKHEKMLGALEREGYITITSGGYMQGALEKIMNDTAAAKELNDKQKIFTAIRRIV